MQCLIEKQTRITIFQLLKKKKIVKECILEITKQFSEKIELISKQIFKNVKKQYEEEIMALKLEITQLKESQNFLSNKYDELKLNLNS